MTTPTYNLTTLPWEEAPRYYHTDNDSNLEIAYINSFNDEGELIQLEALTGYDLNNNHQFLIVDDPNKEGMTFTSENTIYWPYLDRLCGGREEWQNFVAEKEKESLEFLELADDEEEE